MLEPGFWDDNQKAQEIVNALNTQKDTYQTIIHMEEQLEELQMGVELYEETKDQEIFDETVALVSSLNKTVEAYNTKLLLSGPYDQNDVILEIHPGAGGTESQDWGSIIFRMYQRFAESMNFKVEVIDYQAGDEAGIKSVTLEIKGQYAYGYLKSEKGVHRLVRISPFDSNSRRHTSFCSVEVTPIIDQSIEIEISNDDLRIDTYRASGAGGQHVNKTDSAVRITHIPTGTVTQSQSQRSQLQNRETAMNMLKSKLYQLQEQVKQDELDAIKGDHKEIAWGSQIRSYVFHPYSMVKDHRTNYEVGNADKVIDGDLFEFMDAYLKLTMDDLN